MIYPANQKIMSVQFHFIFCLPFVDVVCFDDFVELIRSAADFSCAWNLDVALVTTNTVVQLVAGLDEWFCAEFACCCGDQVADSLDSDSNTSFLVSVSSVFDTFLLFPAAESFGWCWALSNVLVSIDDDSFLWDQFSVGWILNQNWLCYKFLYLQLRKIYK